jgi:hypothetical protein
MADRLSAVEVVVDEAVMRAQAEDVEFMYHVEDVSRNVDGFYDVVKRCVCACVRVCVWGGLCACVWVRCKKQEHSFLIGGNALSFFLLVVLFSDIWRNCCGSWC